MPLESDIVCSHKPIVGSELSQPSNAVVSVAGRLQPVMFAVADADFEPLLTVTVASSVGVLAGAIIVAVICIELATTTFDTATALLSGVVMVTVVAGQEAVAEGLRPIPVSVTE